MNNKKLGIEKLMNPLYPSFKMLKSKKIPLFFNPP